MFLAKTPAKKNGPNPRLAHGRQKTAKTNGPKDKNAVQCTRNAHKTLPRWFVAPDGDPFSHEFPLGQQSIFEHRKPVYSAWQIMRFFAMAMSLAAASSSRGLFLDAFSAGCPHGGPLSCEMRKNIGKRAHECLQDTQKHGVLRRTKLNLSGFPMGPHGDSHGPPWQFP